MTDETTHPETISIRPTTSLVEAAMTHFEVPLGEGLSVSPDGRLAVDADSKGFPAVMGALTGAVMAAHATATLVLPSNVQTLQGVVGLLQLIQEPGPADHQERRLGDAIERLEGVIGNLTGLLGPISG